MDISGADKDGNWKRVWSNYYTSIKTALVEITNEDGSLLTSSISRRNGDHRGIRYGKPIDTTEHKVAEALEEGVRFLDDVFLPEEDFGRRLCMEEHYTRFTNMKKLRVFRESSFIDSEVERMRRKGRSLEEIEKMIEGKDGNRAIIFEEMGLDTYLRSYDDFSVIPRYFKYRDLEYEDYIERLLNYLRDFFARSHPLLDPKTVEGELDKAFESNWSRKLIRDWRVPTCEMEYYSGPSDKLFFTQGTYNSHIKSRNYKKLETSYNSLSEEELSKVRNASFDQDKKISRIEFLIGKYSQYLSKERRETLEHLNRLQSSTKEELDLDKTLRDDFKELRELISELKSNDGKDNEDGDDSYDSKQHYDIGGVADNSEDSDDDIEELQNKVYNPLKLPLGPDGRPMPYWLYKLNGLGIEFKCEICGNCSYWGRRAFERHFQEARHSNALNALGIPNTSHFKEITRISDALELYSSLCKQAKNRIFDEQNGVEMEDSEGNIVTLRSFKEFHSKGVI